MTADDFIKALKLSQKKPGELPNMKPGTCQIAKNKYTFLWFVFCWIN